MAGHVALWGSMISGAGVCRFMAPILHYCGILGGIVSLPHILVAWPHCLPPMQVAPGAHGPSSLRISG